jgi:hypothetical protein
MDKDPRTGFLVLDGYIRWVIVASTHVKNLINISQPHLRMWMVLLGGGEYVICVTF